jgi:hypothetical protein
MAGNEAQRNCQSKLMRLLDAAFILLIFLVTLFHQSRYCIAFKALFIVNRDQATAFWATVFFVVFFCKLFNPYLMDTFQIILHTHFVIISIPVVHTIDLFARILVAFKTKASG